MLIQELLKPHVTQKPKAPLSPDDARNRSIDRKQQQLKVQKKAQQVQKARARLNQLSAQQSKLAGSTL